MKNVHEVISYMRSSPGSWINNISQDEMLEMANIIENDVNRLETDYSLLRDDYVQILQDLEQLKGESR
jgi:hypothetical protein